MSAAFPGCVSAAGVRMQAAILIPIAVATVVIVVAAHVTVRVATVVTEP